LYCKKNHHLPQTASQKLRNHIMLCLLGDEYKPVVAQKHREGSKPSQTHLPTSSHIVFYSPEAGKDVQST
jgi:hypothetical protein